MESSLTGIKDVDINILNNLEDKDLVSYCETHQYAKSICNDQSFWQRRTISKYGEQLDVEMMRKNKGDIKWSDYYIELNRIVKSKYGEYELAKAMENGREDIVKLLKDKGIVVRFITETYTDGGKDETYQSRTGAVPEIQGKYIAYSPSGQIESEGEMFYGKRIGKWLRYYEDGKINTIENYKLKINGQDIKGLIDGEQLVYNKKGKLKIRELFKDGLVVKREFF